MLNALKLAKLEDNLKLNLTECMFKQIWRKIYQRPALINDMHVVEGGHLLQVHLGE